MTYWSENFRKLVLLVQRLKAGCTLASLCLLIAGISGCAESVTVQPLTNAPSIASGSVNSSRADSALANARQAILRLKFAKNNVQASDALAQHAQATADFVREYNLVPVGERSAWLAARHVRLEDNGFGKHAYHSIYVAADFKVRGLTHEFRESGAGAAIVREGRGLSVEGAAVRYPPEGIFVPGTALLIPVDARNMTLKLVNPYQQHRVELVSRSYPLAADFTMPGAMLASKAKGFARTGFAGLVHPAMGVRPAALYLLEPYDPNKYPLLFIHGLQSTPVAFADLVNEVRGDPQLRVKYQIWQYSYPTGTPVFYNASELRRNLNRAVKQLDPGGTAFATNNIVAMGHSLGGLLTHTLVSSSGSKIWGSLITVPPAKLRGDPTTIHEVEDYLCFERNRRVIRAIFISTPHRGSPLADGLVGRVGQAFVRLPDPFTKQIAELARENRDYLVPSAYQFYKGRRLSVIRSLSPHSHALIALSALPVEVPFNSIIGQHADGPVTTSSDGVVPYTSSHLAGAETELVVRSGHEAFKAPAATAEVRRILRQTISSSRKSSPETKLAQTHAEQSSLRTPPPRNVSSN